jgi:uncharacterized membrane protein YtjA (UPF0391 family)
MQGHRLGTDDALYGVVMLYWALVFFILALIAAFFGFGGIAAGAATIAKILFFAFLVVFVVSLVMGLLRGRAPR